MSNISNQAQKALLANPQFFLEHPSLEGADLDKINQALTKNPTLIKKIITVANQPHYIYWDKYKYKSIPADISAEEQWLIVCFMRDVMAIETPIRAYATKKYFKWVRLPNLDRNLHEVDMLVGGGLFPKSRLPSGDKEIYISRGVIEEAIASSQLEGAHTTRVAAKKLILEKRNPRNKSEQMIINNYHAMLSLEEDFKTRKLSTEMLFELHSILTDQTIKESQRGRFRRDDDKIIVSGDIGAVTYTAHLPPKESFLTAEIKRLIAYANDELQKEFIHPLIKAIFLHFWVGYLHPFTDGNGRLARALFYWYLLKKGYWSFAYLPISTYIKKSPKQYAMAYIYAEQDREDLTYFFDYQMRKISQAIKSFRDYVDQKTQQNQEIERALGDQLLFNERQKQLILYFMSKKNAAITAGSHATLNNISRQTAAKDLIALVENKLLFSKREGKYVRYYAAEGLNNLRDKI